ncbi:MAG: NAD(P)-dependent glycerol-3-phosphate dehydrogenase [Dehalococcoidia bacterium]|nr:NAD(P)-dependent glycerol-3-phosphate dehydrogenase [Dehalococcoidia bacterium]
MANLLARNGAAVSVLTRDKDEAKRINTSRGLERIPDLILSSSISAFSTGEMPESFDGLVVAVPAQSFRKSIQDRKISRELPILSASKGIESETLLLMNEILVEEGWSSDKVSVLSGPNFAREIVKDLPALAVVASQSRLQAAFWQDGLSSDFFRVYTSLDVVGVEISGALKNVIAIATGAAFGMGFGTNTCSALMTRGLAEITRLGKSLGASSETFLGLAGVGDLSASCFSPLSRNFQLGKKIGEGQDPKKVIFEFNEVVEGFTTTSVALELAKKQNVDMPVIAGVAAVLDGRISPREAVEFLLTRDLKAED